LLNKKAKLIGEKAIIRQLTGTAVSAVPVLV